MHGSSELLQTLNRHQKTDAAHAIPLLECEQYRVFIRRRNFVILVYVIDD